MRAKHLLSLETSTRTELRSVLDLARGHADNGAEGVLRGKTVCLAFFESSTRTSASFELAARRAGADVITLSQKGSALSKGESLVDTVVTLDQLGADAIVLRHPATGAAALAARYTNAAVINAGDGCGQHPTQALLDLYSLAETWGGFDELAGRKVAIVGDILHSRVARSIIPAFQSSGIELALVAPETLLPREAAAWGLPLLGSVDEAVSWGADALYTLRLQKERMSAALVPSVAEYAAFYGVGPRHLAERPGMRILHPGPVNRGVEIAGDVVFDEASLVRDQVSSGIHIRSAVLALATAARERETSRSRVAA